jgi:hypothetical protein
MIEPHARWMSPSPLWSEARAASDSTALQTPALLRFASDTFMDDFMALLETDPSQLGLLRAVPETWRGPAPRPAAAEPMPAFKLALNRRQLAQRAGGNGLALAKQPPPAPAPAARLKLYQPAHKRFYLLAASLVCQLPGFPDRALDPARPEKATFVLRRLRAPAYPDDPSTRHDATADCVEYAFVTRDHKTGWQRVNATPGAGADVLLAGEEELPLSGVSFDEDDGRKRRILIGLIPVGRREVYVGAPEIQANGDVRQPSPETPTQRLPKTNLYPLQVQVTGPWKNLLEQSDAVRKGIPPPATVFPSPKPEDVKSLVRTTRDRIQTGSWYVLLDFAKFLQAYIPRVWLALNHQAVTLDPAREQPLVDKLTSTVLGSALAADLRSGDSGATNTAASLADAVLKAAAAESDLDNVVIPYTAGSRSGPRTPPAWPTFLFPLADPVGDVPLPSATDIDTLEGLVEDALPAMPAGPMPEPQEVLQPALDPRGNDWFVVRCVFQRPNCDPISPPLVSPPATAFELAGFFDPDAPARPIRIGLPIDISPAGLRKSNKNTVFVLSDLLCGQVNRMKGLTLGDLVRSVLPFPLHADLPVDASPGPCPPEGGISFGMICSLSIPIITICALILLIIIVSLLDIIFHWLPYFMICFPFPRFRAKEST